jgi:hypothetical protein
VTLDCDELQFILWKAVATLTGYQFHVRFGRCQLSSNRSELYFFFWVSPEHYRGDLKKQNDKSRVHGNYPQAEINCEPYTKLGLQLYDSLIKTQQLITASSLDRFCEHVQIRKYMTTRYQVMLKYLTQTGVQRVGAISVE